MKLRFVAIENYEFGESISHVLFHHISQVSVCDLLHLCSVLLSDVWFVSFYDAFK